MCVAIAVLSPIISPLFHRVCIRVACVSVFFPLENVSADNVTHVKRLKCQLGATLNPSQR